MSKGPIFWNLPKAGAKLVRGRVVPAYLRYYRFVGIATADLGDSWRVLVYGWTPPVGSLGVVMVRK